MTKKIYLRHLLSATNVYWKLAEFHDADPEEIFKKVGLNSEMLATPNTWVESEKVLILWNMLAEKVGGFCFGLDADRFWHPSYLGPLGFYWLSSTSLEHGFLQLSRYYSVISDIHGIEIQTTETTASVIILLKYPNDESIARRLGGLSMFHHMAKFNFGSDLTPVKVTLGVDEAICQKKMETHFDTVVEYVKGNDSITYSIEDFTKALSTANEDLLSLASQLMARQSIKIEEKCFIGDVRKAILENLASGTISIEAIAPKLNMSVRSVQRKLNRDGTTFGRLLGALRQELAESYIKDRTLHLEEVAYLTGFSDYSSFYKAFERWTGTSPGRCREKLMVG